MTHKIKHPFNKPEFAIRLNQKRLEKELDINQISKLLGVRRQTYSSWEDPTKPTAYPQDINKQIALSEILDCEFEWLMRGVYEEKRERAMHEAYGNLYERYTTEEFFHHLIDQLMQLENTAIMSLSNFLESLNDHYTGAPLVDFRF